MMINESKKLWSEIRESNPRSLLGKQVYYRTHPTLRSSPCRRTRAHTPERFSLSCLKTLVILRLGVPAVNSRARKTGAGPARAPSATSATCDRSAFIRLCRIPRPQENAACTSYPLKAVNVEVGKSVKVGEVMVVLG